MDKFLLAENPMADTNTLAIVHMLEPIAIILIIEGHVTHKRPYAQYTYGDELFTLVIWHLFTTEFDGEKQTLITNKLLSQAWHWYMAYMQWEDNNIDMQEYGENN